ncbi:MAG: hypothetical protein GY871_20115 [Actinomycetales bacterium]|nr:hypothetical protein [Actinomycetales bacterium]
MSTRPVNVHGKPAEPMGSRATPMRVLAWAWTVSAVLSTLLVTSRYFLFRQMSDDESLAPDEVLSLIEALGVASLLASVLVYGFAIAGGALLLGRARREGGAARATATTALIGVILSFLLLGVSHVIAKSDLSSDSAIAAQITLGNIHEIILAIA